MRKLIRRLARRSWFDRLPGAWVRDARRMRRLVRALDAGGSARQDGIRMAVVVMPWCSSAVPWFSLVCGLLLAASGNRVTFIIDDMPFGESGRTWRRQLACIRSVLSLLRGRHEVISLRDHAAHTTLSEAAQREIDRLATLNVVWAERGETNVTAHDVDEARRQLCTSHGAIVRLLQAKRFDALFVPGGVWGSSGLWIEHARAAGVRVATYDSGGYSTLLLAVNGIACQLQDIPRAFSLLKAHAASPQERRFIVESAQAEMAKRRAGVDTFSSQVKGAREKDPRFAGAVLIALNSSWDSAALGLHAVFESTQEWIVETVRYLLDHTSAPVVVRQHPVERLPIARSSDDYRALLARHFGSHPRLHFIAAEDPVNSYDLLEQAAAVVVYTSTIGIEAAANAKPVVTESSSYYADLGFVRKATTRPQYLDALADAVSGRHVVSPAMRDDALACYYLTQCCNWVFTSFTVPGFNEWSTRDLRELAQEKNVRSIVRALEADIPVAYLNHLARLEVAAEGR